MEIKQLFVATIKHGSVITHIHDNERFYSSVDTFISYDSLEDVVKQCLDILYPEENMYNIEVRHEIFEREIDYNNLEYNDFVYKFGPAYYYFDEKNNSMDKYELYLNKSNNDYLYFPEDFKKENKFKVGDICQLIDYKFPCYGVVLSEPNSLYDSFDKDILDCKWGYHLIIISEYGVKYSYSNDELESNLMKFDNPVVFDEWLDLMSKMIKLNIDEAFNVSKVEEMGNEYLNKTDKWKKYYKECMDKINKED